MGRLKLLMWNGDSTQAWRLTTVWLLSAGSWRYSALSVILCNLTSSHEHEKNTKCNVSTNHNSIVIAYIAGVGGQGPTDRINNRLLNNSHHFSGDKAFSPAGHTWTSLGQDSDWPKLATINVSYHCVLSKYMLAEGVKQNFSFIGALMVYCFYFTWMGSGSAGSKTVPPGPTNSLTQSAARPKTSCCLVHRSYRQSGQCDAH